MKRFVLVVAVFVLATSTAVFSQQLARNTVPDLLARDAAPAPADTTIQLDAAQILSSGSVLPAVHSETAAAAAASTFVAVPVITVREPKPVFHKKVFIAELSVYTVANVLDGITTVRGVRRGFTESPWPRGSSELLGMRPGIGRYTMTMGAVELGAAFAAYRLQHSQNRYLRMVGHSFLLEGTLEHTMGFANNLALPAQPIQ